MNEASLNEHGITHLINWSSSAKCDLFPEIEYMCIHGVRSGRKMMKYLDQAVEFIETARTSGGKAMSHCWHGKNRSVTLLVAYLMKYQNMKPKEANNLIKKTRPQAAPYWEPLEEYSQFLKSENARHQKNWNAPKSKTGKHNNGRQKQYE